MTIKGRGGNREKEVERMIKKRRGEEGEKEKKGVRSRMRVLRRRRSRTKETKRYRIKETTFVGRVSSDPR